MKKVILIFLMSFPMLAIAQEHHLGIRIGEPLSITYKTYIDEQFSLEAMIGRGGANSGQYYRRTFDNNRPTPGAIYSSHSAAGGLSLNLRGAYNEDVSSEFNVSEGALFAYGGAGLQFRSVGVDYFYIGEYPTTAMVPLHEKRTNVDFGAEGFIGSEYFFEDLPMSVFAEVGLFLEIIDRPGHIRLQGGIGARYLF
ncbi:MAG TPA: hypothetical protein VKX33_09505 [Cyclobacteriaceae bacterium]|nr:hypothetical protein [Cyclobacteriaceae bacterium]